MAEASYTKVFGEWLLKFIVRKDTISLHFINKKGEEIILYNNDDHAYKSNIKSMHIERISLNEEEAMARQGNNGD
jgi:hypothetical protein